MHIQKQKQLKVDVFYFTYKISLFKIIIKETIAWLLHSVSCMAETNVRAPQLVSDAELSCSCSSSLPPFLAGVVKSPCMEMYDRTFFDPYLGGSEADSLRSFQLRLFLGEGDLLLFLFGLLLLLNIIRQIVSNRS